MRIIAGTFRGQTFKTYPGEQSRPTLSRVRESLFDILMPFIQDAAFLDAYAGTGGVGLEALSRGARPVAWIEADHHLSRLLGENAGKFDPKQQHTQVVTGDARLEMKKMLQAGRRFDIIFLDPPYLQNEIDSWLQTDWISGLLMPGGRIIFQHARNAGMAEHWGACAKVQARNYGQTTLSFFMAGEK